MSLLINRFYRFGDFTLDTEQRVLLRDGKPLALTPKVFDTLLILIENSGQIVEKEELMRRLWPDTFVEEANLTFNIQQLRKFLSDNARDPRFIGTVTRRGYRFIADVEAVLSDKSPAVGQSAGRLESSDDVSPDAGNTLISQIEAQESGPALNSANENQASTPQEKIGVIPASDEASTSVRKMFIALAAAAVIVLAGAGLVFWRSSNDPDRRLGNRTDGKFSGAIPLKLEKLTGTGQSRRVAISPDGKHIAYTRHIEKQSSIWLRQLATNTNVEIVPPGEVIYGLAFANSGEYLYFVRGAPRTALYRVSLFGGVPTKIVEKPEGDFSVSFDDSQIAFIRQVTHPDGLREHHLIIVNADGTGERVLFVGTYPHVLNVPVWSPDDRAIICSYGNSQGGTQNERIIEVSVADGMKKELSSESFFHVTKLAWLPDRSGLIMSGRKNFEDITELWRVSYPSMETLQITEGLSTYLDLSIAAKGDKAVATQSIRNSDVWVGSSQEPRNLKKITQATDKLCWTPNGRLIYGSDASGNGDLWIMRADGTDQRQLTVGTAADFRPVVTPDNRYIVFVSNRTGALQIWRMNIDGSNQVPLTNRGSNDYPAVSPDGKWVIYNTTDDWHLWRVPIEGGEPVRLTDYPASYPSVSPDGKMIACLERNEPKVGLSILILGSEGGYRLKRIEFTRGGLSGSRMQWTADGKALVYAAELAGGAITINQQSLDSGPPEEIMSFDQDELFDFGYSIDGQFFAVIRGAWKHDVVLISDLNRYGAR